jgi:hypothetical protein
MGESLHITTAEEFDQLETAMLFTERQVAEKLHIKPCTVRNERLQGAISYIKIRSRYFYTEEQIEEYIRARTTTSKLTSPTLKEPDFVPESSRSNGTPEKPQRSARDEAILARARETFRRWPKGLRRPKNGVLEPRGPQK